MKVQQLAKELGKNTKEFIKLLRELDIKVKSASTRFDDNIVQQIRDIFKKDISSDENKKKLDGQFIMEDMLIKVGSLAELLEVNLAEIMKVFLKRGMMVNLNTEVDFQTAKSVAEDLELVLIQEESKFADQGKIRQDLDEIEAEEIDKYSNELENRAPVITIMGHVDHGKTLLLDTIRHSSLIDSEEGGITQHIGAYQVDVNKHKLTFLDTPGHAAFTTLRARGAQVTDIAILVIAAEEGMKPQTIEAIHHAKAAGVPIIVALNKIDKPEADIERCKQQLTEHDLVPEEWGGKTIVVPISAKSGKGIKDLLEMVVLVAEMLELKANVNCMAKAVVIESRLSRTKGPMATLLIKSGTLKIGDNFVIGTKAGKVKALFNDRGESVNLAKPGEPIELLGLSEVPSPGHILEVIENERAGRVLTEERLLEETNAAKQGGQVSLETLAAQFKTGETQLLNLIIKADVIGSIEAIVNFIEQIDSEDVHIIIIHTATGMVNENDIMLAKASAAIIITFNVEVNSAAKKLAEEEAVEIRSYKVIYNILEDFKKVIEGMYKPIFEEIQIGEVEVRQIYKYSRVGSIAGCYVLSGIVKRNAMAKVYREKEMLFDGKTSSLKRFKEDVKEVKHGFECGLVLDGFNDFAEGDVVKFFELKEKNKG